MLNEKQKELDIDLWIITIVSFVSLGIFMIFQKEIYGIVKNEELTGGIWNYNCFYF